MTSSENRLSS